MTKHNFSWTPKGHLL